MKTQFKTVNEIAKLTGITVRALHYYDEINFLKPSNSSQAGYRLYSNEEVETLQQIIIGDYISSNSLLCSDSAKNYISFANLKGLEHKQVNAHKKKYVIEKLYHTQHVNSYHGRLKKWINLHFNGVSTKYMDNYLFWHRFLELNKSLDKVELKKTLLTNVLAMNKSTTIRDLRPVKSI